MAASGHAVNSHVCVRRYAVNSLSINNGQFVSSPDGSLTVTFQATPPTVRE